MNEEGVVNENSFLVDSKNGATYGSRRDQAAAGVQTLSIVKELQSANGPTMYPTIAPYELSQFCVRSYSEVPFLLVL